MRRTVGEKGIPSDENAKGDGIAGPICRIKTHLKVERLRRRVHRSKNFPDQEPGGTAAEGILQRREAAPGCQLVKDREHGNHRSRERRRNSALLAAAGRRTCSSCAKRLKQGGHPCRCSIRKMQRIIQTRKAKRQQNTKNRTERTKRLGTVPRRGTGQAK